MLIACHVSSSQSTLHGIVVNHPQRKFSSVETPSAANAAAARLSTGAAVGRPSVISSANPSSSRSDLGRFDAVQRTIVWGTFVVVRPAARRVRDGGAIVNLSGAAVGSALPIEAASAASDAAVGAMIRVFGCDLRGRGITINAVAPGLEGACGAPAIADVVAFLVGSSGRSVNGQVIQVDCGEPLPARVDDADG